MQPYTTIPAQPLSAANAASLSPTNAHRRVDYQHTPVTRFFQCGPDQTVVFMDLHGLGCRWSDRRAHDYADARTDGSRLESWKYHRYAFLHRFMFRLSASWFRYAIFYWIRHRIIFAQKDQPSRPIQNLIEASLNV